MTDSNDDDRGRPRGGSGPRRPGGGGPPRKPPGARPFRSRDGDERPRRPRPEGDLPFRQAGDRPFRPRAERPDPPPREEAPASPPEPVEERIAKVIARAGVASRRDAEAMIAEGRVTLNGETLTSPAVNVGPADRITVDGEPLPEKERTRLWIFHKPRGLVTTARDPEGRPTVFEQLPEDLPRVVAIGRLDINTEGLLLLTNDGGLAKVIAHPETGWLRRYKARAHGDVTQADLDRLAGGVTIDGMEYGPIEARLDRVQGDNVWLTLGLREGKNREVKRILEHLGLQVNRLIRLSFGPFQLGDLEPGLVEEVRTKVLRDQLGDALAAEAGVDFASPVREPIAPFGKPPREPREAPQRRERPESWERRERPERRDRPARGERPFRDRDEHPRGRRDDEAPRKRPDRLAPRRSVWRAGEDAEEGRHRKAPPRRGADPREARAATAERPRQRVGAIAAEGRKVLVERLVSEPREEPREARRERPARPGRRPDAPAGDDRPHRRAGPAGARPYRSSGDERRSDRGPRSESGPPRRPRPEGERPFRGRSGDEAPRRGPPRGGEDGPRRGPPRGAGRSGGPPRGGAKGGFKGGPRGSGGHKGGPRGGAKGPPRGRR